MTDEFFTKEALELWIEKNKRDHADNYLDTLIVFMEENNMDEEDIKDLLSTTLVLKLKDEAIKNRSIRNSIKRTDFDQVFEKNDYK